MFIHICIYNVMIYPAGRGVWLAGMTLVESSLSTLPTGWLWAGLFFVFITLGLLYNQVLP